METTMETRFTARQRAAQAEIRLGRITTGEWCETAVTAVLREMDTEALRCLVVSHWKFSGGFAAGRKVADWGGQILDERESCPDCHGSGATPALVEDPDDPTQDNGYQPCETCVGKGVRS